MTAGGATYRPQAEDGLALGAVFALLAHVVLVGALALGVSWKTKTEAVVEAEVWAEVPRVAAPPAPPVPQVAPPVETPKEEAPLPPKVEPPVADIAQAPQPKPKPKPRPKPPEKPPEKPVVKPAKAPPVVAKKPAPVPPARQLSDAQRDAQHKANVQRMMNQLGGLGQSGAATQPGRSAGPSATYGGRLRSRILPNIVFTGTVSGNPTVFVEIRCTADGRIISKKILEPSGANDWDAAVLRGIDRTEFLPMDDNGRLPDTVFQIGFSPKDR